MIYNTNDAWIRFLIALAMRNTYPILPFEDCFVTGDQHAVVLCRSPCLGLVPVAHVSTIVRMITSTFVDDGDTRCALHDEAFITVWRDLASLSVARSSSMVLGATTCHHQLCSTVTTVTTVTTTDSGNVWTVMMTEAVILDPEAGKVRIQSC